MPLNARAVQDRGEEGAGDVGRIWVLPQGQKNLRDSFFNDLRYVAANLR